MGILPPVRIPPGLVGVETGTDTLSGKYSPSEIWSKSGDRITVDINVLADTASRKWVPNLSVFFNDDIDFERGCVITTHPLYFIGVTVFSLR